MTPNVQNSAPQEPLGSAILRAFGYYLGRKRTLIVLAVGLVTAGLALNWSWLVAAGIAPVLIGFLPCAAMCGLGLCMAGKGGSNCSSKETSEAQGALGVTPPADLARIGQLPAEDGQISKIDAGRQTV